MIFQLIGLIVCSLFLLGIAGAGMLPVMYNPTNARLGPWLGMAATVLAIYAIYWLWHTYSPLSVVVTP